MIRLVLISISVILFPYTKEICDYYYPICGAPYDNIWDNLKHFYYLVSILLIALMFWFEPDVRYEKFVKLGMYVFVIGELIPAMIDKRLNADDPDKHWYDFAFILLSVYGGMKDIFPKLHKRIALFIPFINEKRYDLLCRMFK